MKSKGTNKQTKRTINQSVAYFTVKSLTLPALRVSITRKLEFFLVEEFLQPFR